MRVNKKLMFWMWILLSILIISFWAKYFTNQDPNMVNPLEILMPPDAEHRFGTDDLGRDVFARVLYGGRITILVSVISIFLSLFFGTLLGGVAGYFGGVIDFLSMRFIEIVMAIPIIIIAFAMQAILENRVAAIIIVISIATFPATVRVVRGRVLELRDKGFVKTAILLGTPKIKIVSNHLLRNCLDSIVIICVIHCAQAVMYEVTFSFLGIGLPAQVPSWGNVLFNTQTYILRGAWWVAAFPGTVIILFLLSINYLGESLKKKYGIKN